jgi:hypothetical protein
MTYRLSRYTENPIVLLELTGVIEDKSISQMLLESIGYFQLIQGAACLVVDMLRLEAINHERFANALRVFERTSSTFKNDGPIFIALVGEKSRSVSRVLEKLNFIVPIFKSREEASLYLELKIGGAYLRQTLTSLHTDELDTLHLRHHTPPMPDSVIGNLGTPVFPNGGVLRVQDIETRRVMLILPKGELIVGRQHPQSPKPDIDLSMWEAFHKGVSRQHARFSLDSQNKLMLTDLNSTNGTQLNGVPLVPGRLYEIHDGDLITFGGLTVRLYYQDTIEVAL